MKGMKRNKVNIPPVLLRSPTQLQYLFKVLPNLPLDEEYPIEVVIREQVKKRKMSLNDAMWAGPLRDIERQAWHQGRQYSALVWHEHFKEAYLPDENDPDFDPSHVVDPETYHKWGINPWNGDRCLTGSTTQLTDKGMTIYMLQLEAEAAQEYQVMFTTRDEPYGRIA